MLKFIIHVILYSQLVPKANLTLTLTFAPGYFLSSHKPDPNPTADPNPNPELRPGPHSPVDGK